MQKKVIAFITSLCIVITCSAPSYAIDISSPSAISLSTSRFSSRAISAPSATLASTDTYVIPSSSSDSIYYFSGTNTSSTLQFVYTWANLAKAISYSIANSIFNLSSQLKSAISSQTTSINTGLANVEKAVDDVWTRIGVILGSVDQLEGYVDGIEAYLNSISGSVDGVEGKIDTSNTTLSNIKSDTANIYSYLSNHQDVDLQPIIDVLNHSDFVGESYTGSLSQTIWQSNDNGSWTTFNQNVSQARRFQNLLIFLTALQRNQALTNASLRRGAGDDVITHNDLTTTSITSQSVQQTLQNYGTNISSLLARLSFVLASDEEIEARQAAENNQSAAVNYFIKPSGSGSASASDIGEIANVSSSMSDMLGSDVSPSTAFSSMQPDSDAWSWFSQENADSLDQRGNRRRLLKSNTHSYVSDYYEELESIIGVRLW